MEGLDCMFAFVVAVRRRTDFIIIMFAACMSPRAVVPEAGAPKDSLGPLDRSRASRRSGFDHVEASGAGGDVVRSAGSGVGGRERGAKAMEHVAVEFGGLLAVWVDVDSRQLDEVAALQGAK